MGTEARFREAAGAAWQFRCGGHPCRRREHGYSPSDRPRRRPALILGLLLPLSGLVAQASEAESTATRSSGFSDVPGLGGCTPVQLSQVDAEAPADPDPTNMPVTTGGAAAPRRHFLRATVGASLTLMPLTGDGVPAARSWPGLQDVQRCRSRQTVEFELDPARASGCAHVGEYPTVMAGSAQADRGAHGRH